MAIVPSFTPPVSPPTAFSKRPEFAIPLGHVRCFTHHRSITAFAVAIPTTTTTIPTFAAVVPGVATRFAEAEPAEMGDWCREKLRARYVQPPPCVLRGRREHHLQAVGGRHTHGMVHVQYVVERRLIRGLVIGSPS